MTYVAPSTVVAGQTYSAANHNVIVNDIIDHEDRLDTVQNAQYPYRNVLINGAMQIAQRATSATGISAGSTYHTADRWGFSIASAGTWTHAVSADAPDGSGFRNSLRVTCSATAASAAGTNITIQQPLEGQTLQHIKKGTANAQPLTLSFWAKSNTTGTYIAELYDTDNTRSVSGTYTISAANTWEQKTITFPADTTGTLNNDNGGSLTLSMWLSAGTTFTSGTLATAWASATNANRAVGQTNLAATANNYFAITGVQLEPGSQASPYEFVLYQDELRRCQRYYYKRTLPAFGGLWLAYSLGSLNNVGGYFQLPQTLRAVPTLISSSGSFEAFRNAGSGGINVSSFSISNANTETIFVAATLATTPATDVPYSVRERLGVAGGWFDVSAEL